MAKKTNKDNTTDETPDMAFPPAEQQIDAVPEPIKQVPLEEQVSSSYTTPEGLLFEKLGDASVRLSIGGSVVVIPETSWHDAKLSI